MTHLWWRCVLWSGREPTWSSIEVGYRVLPSFSVKGWQFLGEWRRPTILKMSTGEKLPIKTVKQSLSKADKFCASSVTTSELQQLILWYILDFCLDLWKTYMSSHVKFIRMIHIIDISNFLYVLYFWQISVLLEILKKTMI